jgi:hypothetical protein
MKFAVSNKRYLFVLLVLFDVFTAFAQYERSYSPALIQDTIPQEIKESLKAKLVARKKALSAEKVQHRNFIFSLYEKHNETLVKYFNDDYFIVTDELTDYLQSILKKIVEANPLLQDQINIYVHRSSSPNAFTFWDGTIGVTLGLLARMENEDEVAFVICHELAHYYSNHIDSRIRQIAKANYDPEIEKDIRSIKNSQYEKYTRLKKIYRDLNLSLKHHSRGEEFAADSIGLTYFLRTTYNPKASIRLMEILDSAQISIYKKNIDLKKVFTLQKYPFKENWLVYAKSNMKHNTSDEDFGDSDTVKTHPDCKRRIISLKQQLRAKAIELPINLKSDLVTQKMALRSELEMIESEAHFKHYGKSFFTTLAALDKFPNNIYVHSMVGRNLALIYQSMKDHQFGKTVQLPDERFDENYDRILSFLHILRIMETASLGYYYMVEKDESYFVDEEFLYALWLVCKMPVSELSAQLVKDDYLKRFPEGKYASLLNKSK